MSAHNIVVTVDDFLNAWEPDNNSSGGCSTSEDTVTASYNDEEQFNNNLGEREQSV